VIQRLGNGVYKKYVSHNSLRQLQNREEKISLPILYSRRSVVSFTNKGNLNWERRYIEYTHMKYQKMMAMDGEWKGPKILDETHTRRPEIHTESSCKRGGHNPIIY
jgi:hypothetical protein